MWPSLGSLSSYMRDKIDIKYQETDQNTYNWSWPVHELKKKSDKGIITRPKQTNTFMVLSFFSYFSPLKSVSY